MRDKKFNFSEFLLSLIKCGGYYGVYFLINILASVLCVVIFAIAYPEQDANALAMRLAIPLTLLVNAVFLLIASVFYNNSKSYISFSHKVTLRPLNRRVVPFILCLGICTLFAVNLILGLIPFPESWLSQLESNSDMIVSSSVFMQIVCVGIVGPIAEEVLFRGLMLNTLKKSCNQWLAIVISSVAFGIAHGNPIGIIYATGLGILMGWMFLKTKSLASSCIFHIVYNIMSLFASYISPLVLGLISIVSVGVCAVCIVFIAKIPAIPENDDENIDEV